MLPVLVIVGPTAVGKSALSVNAAEMLDTEIISADSMQVYRGMSVGVAAPPAQDLARVRHHFVGIIEPDERFSAADFARGALDVVRELHAQRKIPLVVGGSGLYVRALVDGIFPGPPADKRLRQELKEVAAEKGSRHLYQRLKMIDPTSAEKIHPKDIRRLIRALEVFELTGSPISELQQKYRDAGPDLDFIMVGLERQRRDLYNRIDERVERMFELGLIAEVTDLLERGYGNEIDRIRPLGYPEVKAYLFGEIDLDRTKYVVKRNSRRYAKRQYTWFKHDPKIRWFRFDPYEETGNYAAQICRAVGIIQGRPRQSG